MRLEEDLEAVLTVSEPPEHIMEWTMGVKPRLSKAKIAMWLTQIRSCRGHLNSAFSSFVSAVCFS